MEDKTDNTHSSCKILQDNINIHFSCQIVPNVLGAVMDLVHCMSQKW